MNFSPEKLFLVGLIALVVLGPNRVPDAARNLGRFITQMRRMSSSFQSEVRDALAEPRDALTNAVGDLGMGDLRQSLQEAATSPFADFAPAPEPISATSQPLPPSAAPILRSSGAAAGVPAAPDDPSLN